MQSDTTSNSENLNDESIGSSTVLRPDTTQRVALEPNDTSKVNSKILNQIEITPLDQAKIQQIEADTKSAQAQTLLYERIKFWVPYLIAIVTGLLAWLGTIYTYQLNNISEPIGGIKADIENLKKSNDEIRSDIKEIRNVKNQSQTDKSQ